MHLFAYGTLMDAEIMSQVSGARYRSQKATLANYVRKKVRGEIYPAITRQAGSSVDGILYFNVSSQSFERLDKYEGSLYHRTGVVALGDDGERINVHTYVISSAHRLSTQDWSPEKFLENNKQSF